jgi:hypothetical protein
MPTLEITTMIGCPLACTFCPQDKLAAAYTSEKRALSLVDFKTVIAKVPEHVRIDFSGMSEPWANRAATDMLEHALDKGRHVAVYTTLQGMRDPGRVADLLMDYVDQVEAIVIHLPDARGNMQGFRPSDMYDEACATFRDMEGNIFGERLQFMTMDEDNQTAGRGPTGMLWSAVSRAGNLDRRLVDGQAIEGEIRHATPVTCSFTPFYDQNVLLPNGDVVLCCMDYSLKHRIGNLLTDDYYDLFRRDGMGAVVAGNMQYGCEETICKKCSRARLHDLGETKHFWSWSC